MAKTFAKIETPEGELTLSKRATDELRMLLALRQRMGFAPEARPEVFVENYDAILEFLEENGGRGEFLSDRRPDL